ncbi:MAG: IPT/TIG domain-containing protein [Chloroflexota bacterium]
MKTTKKVWLASFVLLMGLIGPASSWAQDAYPAPGDGAQAPNVLTVTTVEPTSLSQVTGGTLTVLGTDFTTDTYVRMIGYGILQTTFVNSTSLTAQVPAGVGSNSYQIEVSDGTNSAVWAGTIQITAAPNPTAIPGPTNTPSPAGLTVTGVEPAQVNRDTGTSITVFGTGFTADSAVRLVGAGVLDTTYIGPNTLSALIPADYPPIAYQLQVIRGTDSATWESGFLTIFVPPTPTPVPSSGNSTVLTAPDLLVQNTSFDRDAIQPGDSFIVSFDLVNIGGRDAKNIKVTFNAPTVAVPVGSGNSQFIELVDEAEDGEVRVAFPLIALESLAGGQYNLAFDLTWLDADGRSYSGNTNVGLTLGAAAPTPTPTPVITAKPRLVLAGYSVSGAAEPGSRFSMDLSIINQGGADAQNVQVKFGGDSAASLAPFALINSSNIEFISSIPAGSSVDVSKEFLVEGNASTGPKNLSLIFDYEDDGGTAIESPYSVAVLVERPPQFQIDFFDRPTFVEVGQPVDLSVEIFNIGSDTVNVNTIEMDVDPRPADVTGPIGTIFSGPLGGGTSISVDGTFFPEEAGPTDVIITVNYIDDLNQNQQVQERLSLNVDDAPDFGEEVPLDEFGNPIIDEEFGSEIDEVNPTTTRIFQIGGALLALIAIIFVGVRIARRQ